MLEDTVDGLGLGRVDKTAGIDNGQIRPVGVRRGDIPGLTHQMMHLFAVHQILGAAQRNKRKCRLSLCHAFSFSV